MLTPDALAALVASVDEAALASASGVSRKTLSRIKAKTTKPSFDRVERIKAEAERLMKARSKPERRTSDRRSSIKQES